MKNIYPRSFSHIGLSVPDVDKAVKCYTEVMSWHTIVEPTKIVEDDSPVGQICTETFGKGWDHLHIAHLSTTDRVGVELFSLRIKRILKTTLNTGEQASLNWIDYIQP